MLVENKPDSIGLDPVIQCSKLEDRMAGSSPLKAAMTVSQGYLNAFSAMKSVCLLFSFFGVAFLQSVHAGGLQLLLVRAQASFSAFTLFHIRAEFFEIGGARLFQLDPCIGDAAHRDESQHQDNTSENTHINLPTLKSSACASRERFPRFHDVILTIPSSF